MEKLYVNKPVYPIVSLVASMLIFFIGLFLSKDMMIVVFLAFLTVIYLLYGYTKVLCKAVPLFALIGVLIGAGSAITSGSYMAGVQTAGRILLLAYASVLMVALPPVQLTRNLVQWKFPRIITLGMLAAIRFVPLLIGEARQIREAMKTRGASTAWYNPSCAFRAFIIPFLMRMISMSDTMAVSMETRGFVLSDKSAVVYKEVKFTARDGAFVLLLLALMTGVMLA